jgi:hypothetical protein
VNAVLDHLVKLLVPMSFIFVKRKKLMKPLLLLCILTLFFASTVSAHTVHLKSGRQIKALEVWEERDQVFCKISPSITVGFPKEDVLKIEKEQLRSKSPDPFQYDIWQSGIELREALFLAERHNIPIRARGRPSATGFNHEVWREAESERVFAYHTRQLDHPVRVVMMFTPINKVLYQVQVIFTAPRNSPLYSDLKDILSERYGKPSKPYHPLVDSHIWRNRNSVITLKGGWEPLTVEYLDVAMDKMNTKELEHIRNEEKNKNVQAGSGVF